MGQRQAIGIEHTIAAGDRLRISMVEGDGAAARGEDKLRRRRRSIRARRRTVELSRPIYVERIASFRRDDLATLSSEPGVHLPGIAEKEPRRVTVVILRGFFLLPVARY